jgi:hypothetical protein
MPPIPPPRSSLPGPELLLLDDVADVVTIS